PLRVRKDRWCIQADRRYPQCFEAVPDRQHRPPVNSRRRPAPDCKRMSKTRIVPATELDVPVILDMIHALADYEKLAHLVTATEARLREPLFGIKPAAEVVSA